MAQARHATRSPDGKVPTKRLGVNLPESLHTRFKTACSATNRRMVWEVLEMVERRTAELEAEASLRRGSDDAKAHLVEVLDRALACNHPTGDIQEMLADMEDGRR